MHVNVNFVPFCWGEIRFVLLVRNGGWALLVLRAYVFSGGLYISGSGASLILPSDDITYTCDLYSCLTI